ncbi:MAG TPA: D-mannonate epimerase, partial [Sumerlaeia bacterium]|nr:D-mannonate epimerase [Sumerlaeia bacterium]
FLGAVYGMERIMGRAYSPVRDVFDYMSEHFARDLPISYLLTVRAMDPATSKLVTRGLYAGDDDACFQRGARLSREVNVNLLDTPIQRAVVYLNPDEYKSAWLGNKAIYRMRMAMADGGELIILAPGLHRFGEDPGIDRLIRKYGYRGMERTMASVEGNEDLRANLAAAAHLIHGSSEERFSIAYCTGQDSLSREEIEGVGFRHADLKEALARYSPDRLTDGFNRLPDGERIFYVSNPALGLWGLRAQFR